MSKQTDAAPGRIELRLARDDEARVVRELAALDDARELKGEVLLALVDGAAVAALSLADRRVVANPFLPTRKVVTVLRLRAEQMLGAKRPERRRRRPRLPLA